MFATAASSGLRSNSRRQRFHSAQVAMQMGTTLRSVSMVSRAARESV